MKSWKEALVLGRLVFGSLRDLRDYLLPINSFLESQEFGGVPPAAVPIYVGSLPARTQHSHSAPQQSCRLPSSHHFASVLLSCSHTFLKGGKSPSDMEFLFGRVSLQFFTQALLLWNTKLKSNKNTQNPSRKKIF